MGLPAIELTELTVPGHLGQAVGFTSSDCYRLQWSHSMLRHENEKTMQINEQTRAPQGQLCFINLPLQKSALSRYNKRKLAVLDSWTQQIPKEKRQEGTPRTPSPAMASSPKLQRMGTATTPGKKQRTCSGEPTGSCPGCSQPPSPGARLVRSPVVVGDTGGHDAGRLQSRREVGRSKSTTFCLQHC